MKKLRTHIVKIVRCFYLLYKQPLVLHSSNCSSLTFPLFHSSMQLLIDSFEAFSIVIHKHFKELLRSVHFDIREYCNSGQFEYTSVIRLTLWHCSTHTTVL